MTFCYMKIKKCLPSLKQHKKNDFEGLKPKNPISLRFWYFVCRYNIQLEYNTNNVFQV